MAASDLWTVCGAQMGAMPTALRGHVYLQNMPTQSRGHGTQRCELAAASTRRNGWS